MKGIGAFFLIILVLLAWCYHRYVILKKDWVVEKELLRKDEFDRTIKIKKKNKREKIKNLISKSIIYSIAFSPYIWVSDNFERIVDSLKSFLFTISVLFCKNVDFLQCFIDNLDKWFSKLFHGKLDKDIQTLDLKIESRQNKISKIEMELKRFSFFQS